jgi:hypothetical protein
MANEIKKDAGKDPSMQAYKGRIQDKKLRIESPWTNPGFKSPEERADQTFATPEETTDTTQEHKISQVAAETKGKYSHWLEKYKGQREAGSRIIETIEYIGNAYDSFFGKSSPDYRIEKETFSIDVLQKMIDLYGKGKNIPGIETANTLPELAAIVDGLMEQPDIGSIEGQSSPILSNVKGRMVIVSASAAKRVKQG